MTNGQKPSEIVGSGFRFDSQYTQLPDVFYDFGNPGAVPQPQIVAYNQSLAHKLGLSDLTPEEQAALFSGQALAEGSTPFSQAYAGHQFGGFAILGDGRAHVLGEHLTPEGKRVDIQLKGSGRTRYSRGGDGRATLGPMLREYVISEAMAALGIATTRILAVVATGATVLREQPLPGAILTRVAASHLRIGTFQFANALDAPEQLRQLLHYAIERHYPALANETNPALALWDEVAQRHAKLVADWMRVGFVHGVMNTDNVTISGETIDYGPCAFMDRYASSTVFSSIDRNGRYAFGNQPYITQWNLARFAEALLPVIDDDEEKAVAMAEERVDQFRAWMSEAWTDMMRDKLGLPHAQDDDQPLATDLLTMMEGAAVDYTDTFRALSGATELPTALTDALGWSEWRKRWDARCGRAPGEAPNDETTTRMRKANPAVIPRNHLVEAALTAAVQSEDMTPLQELLDALRAPYEEREALAPFQAAPPESFQDYTTFCGT